MWCYKDRTYCPFHLTCKNGLKCDRALTDFVAADANKRDLPISQYTEPPTLCYIEIKGKE